MGNVHRLNSDFLIFTIMNTNTKNDTRGTKLNQLVSSWVNIGRPESFGCREHYMKADGHEVRCSGTFVVLRSSLPAEALEALPDDRELCVWAQSENGKRSLVIGYGVAGDLYGCVRITDLPLGVFWPHPYRMAYEETREFRRFAEYGEIFGWGKMIQSDNQKKLSAVTPASAG
jgi:hypothetical protein